MNSQELKGAIIGISGSMRAFARDYELDYQRVIKWCTKTKPNKAIVALVREILKSKLPS